jgi:hypothetical protein
MTTTTVKTIKCNHFFCKGKFHTEKGNATTLVHFLGTENVLAHDTYCCPRCFEAYSPLIERNPAEYTVTEL